MTSFKSSLSLSLVVSLLHFSFFSGNNIGKKEKSLVTKSADKAQYYQMRNSFTRLIYLYTNELLIRLYFTYHLFYSLVDYHLSN